MKRHESLQPLSRQHHEALILAQLIKKGAPEYKGLPTTLEGKREYTLNKFREILVHHFEAEELILIPFILGISKEIDELAERVIEEHQQIASLIESIRLEIEIEDNLDKLGHLLSNHIRLEERRLFESIQNKLPEDKLNKLKTQLEFLDNKKVSC